MPVYSAGKTKAFYLEFLYNSCVFQGLFGFLMKSPSQGADTILHASVSPSLEGMGGLYLENSRAAEPSSFSIRLDHQSKMWSTSLEMLGIKDFFSTDR